MFDTANVPLLTGGWTDWYCPACGLEDRTRPFPPNAAHFHTCPRLHYITAPMVRAGYDARLVAVERQDYLAGEIQAAGDDGRPYMAVRTEYADGRNDTAVHAPLARAAFRT